MRATAIEGAGDSSLGVAYELILVSVPFVALVLSVGKKPSLFWTAGEI